MADNKKSVQTLVYESQESLYEKALKKMNVDKLIVQFAFKIENYQVAATMFEEVGEYKDAPELAQKCRTLVEKTKAEQIEDQYMKALERKEKCKTLKDYKSVAELFEKFGTYKDAENQKLLCQETVNLMQKKKKTRMYRVIFIFVIFIGVISASIFSGFYKYVIGSCCYELGYYEIAEEIFENLKGSWNSEIKLEGCRNEILKLEKEDAKQKLINAKVGSEFMYGTHTWKVLERNGDYVYMIATQVDNKSEFYHVPFHNTQDAVNWEDSALRQWLNTEVLESIFSDEERSRLVLMETEASNNTEYKTDGGKDTEDYIRILSVEEAEKYNDILKTLGLEYWLRTPGHSEDTAVYMSAGHSVMDYGYPVTAEQISVRPVIMVDCSGLKEE